VAKARKNRTTQEIDDSVLANQKPERKSSRHKKTWRRRFMITAAILGGLNLGFGTFSLYQRFGPTSKKVATVKKSFEWDLDVRVASGTQPTAKQLKQIQTIVHNNLSSPSQNELLKVARLVQKETLAMRVSLLRTNAKQLVMTIAMRTPALRIEADGAQYVTADGDIYGKAGEDAQELPMIRGIFAGRSSVFLLTDEYSVALSETEKALVDEALTLYKEATAAGFAFTEYRYVTHRGFEAFDQTTELEVSLGRAPYESRLQNLRQVLAGLKKRGSQATRIELDYDGKAFIKEKKI